MITTRKKIIVSTQKKVRNKSKQYTKENHQNAKERERQEERNHKHSQKTMNKMAVSTYLLIITLYG